MPICNFLPTYEEFFWFRDGHSEILHSKANRKNEIVHTKLVWYSTLKIVFEEINLSYI